MNVLDNKKGIVMVALKTGNRVDGFNVRVKMFTGVFTTIVRDIFKEPVNELMADVAVDLIDTDQFDYIHSEIKSLMCPIALCEIIGRMSRKSK